MNKYYKALTVFNAIAFIIIAVGMFSGYSTAEDAVYFGKDNYLLSNSTDFKLVVRDTARIQINKNSGILTHVNSGITLGKNANNQSEINVQNLLTSLQRQHLSEFEDQLNNPLGFRDEAVTIYYKSPYIVFANNEDGTIKIDLSSGTVSTGLP